MCGRVTLATPASEVAEIFQLPEMPMLEPRYNIAPTQGVLVLRTPSGQHCRQIALLRWGFIPHWATDASVGNSMINARSESVMQKSAFREAFKKRRCLVIVDGFYEWKKIGKRRDPHLFTMADTKPFALAGLWEENYVVPLSEAPLSTAVSKDARIESFTVLTTSANELVAALHDRMPLILENEHYDLWLDPAVNDPAVLKPLLKPYPAEKMLSRPVNDYVNDAKNEGVRCLDAPEAPKVEKTLWDV